MITRLDQLEMIVQTWKRAGYGTKLSDDMLNMIGLVRWLMSHHAETLEEAKKHDEEDGCDVCADLMPLLEPALPIGEKLPPVTEENLYTQFYRIGIQIGKDEAKKALLKVYNETPPGSHKDMLSDALLTLCGVGEAG